MIEVYFGADETTTEVYDDVLSMLSEAILEFDPDKGFWGICRLTNLFTEVCNVTIYYKGEEYNMQVGIHELINIYNGEYYDKSVDNR